MRFIEPNCSSSKCHCHNIAMELMELLDFYKMATSGRVSGKSVCWIGATSTGLTIRHFKLLLSKSAGRQRGNGMCQASMRQKVSKE